MKARQAVRKTEEVVVEQRTPPPPKTIDHSRVDLDIFADLLSFHARTVVLALNRDLDAQMSPLPQIATGTGKISTLLLIEANPGIRPSVIAHYILKDRSAMVRLLAQFVRAGLVEQRVSEQERRAHELFITPKGKALASRVRAITLRQNERFFDVLTAEEQAGLLKGLKKLYEAHVATLPMEGDLPIAGA